MKQFETVTFKGTAVHTNGMMPQKGEMAPDFTAVAGDLSELSLGSLKGKRVPYPWIYLLHKDAFVRLKALRT